jgi:hypothetical protein
MRSWQRKRPPYNPLQVIMRYYCSCCEADNERYRAIDNLPFYCHLCPDCAKTLFEKEPKLKAHYVDLDMNIHKEEN